MIKYIFVFALIFFISCNIDDKKENITYVKQNKGTYIPIVDTSIVEIYGYIINSSTVESKISENYYNELICVIRRPSFKIDNKALQHFNNNRYELYRILDNSRMDTINILKQKKYPIYFELKSKSYMPIKDDVYINSESNYKDMPLLTFKGHVKIINGYIE